MSVRRRSRRSSRGRSADTTRASSAPRTSPRVGVIGQEIESTNPALRPDEFIPGPLFANAVVLDEFNRATPRMQSGLLEAMEEHAVTVGKRRHALPRPFFCIGTMNPHDNTGTFELAHASCDRFAMRTGIGYPSESGERDLLTRFSNADDAQGERSRSSRPATSCSCRR